jgi:hypothetical protein
MDQRIGAGSWLRLPATGKPGRDAAQRIIREKQRGDDFALLC